jgi:hypothetical protein
MNPALPSGKKLVPTESQKRLTASPMVDYLYIRDANLDDHMFSSDGKELTLKANRGDFSQWKDPVIFVGKRQRSLEGKTSVLLSKPSVTTSGLIAGLAYYKDERRYMNCFTIAHHRRLSLR